MMETLGRARTVRCIRLLVVVAAAWLGAFSGSAFGQFDFVGPGSTAQGDILRGAGVMYAGAGLYNYYTAMADSINVDSMIRLNQYIYLSIKEDNAEKARRRAAEQRKRLVNYTAIHDRIINSPNQTDMMKGDALNALLDELSGPKFAPSTFRMNSFKLDTNLVRKIPFFYAPHQATIAMSRISAIGRWPIGLRGPEFARERENYQLALDRVLELQIDRKTTREPLLKLEQTIQDLFVRLDQVVPVANETLYKEAKTFIRGLETSKELMKKNDIEKIMGEIDRYSGTTVYDLIEFMRAFKLRFAVPEIGDERRAYPKLYAALKEQMEELGQLAERDGRVPEAAPGLKINGNKG